MYIGLETSVTNFNDAGSARYSSQLALALLGCSLNDVDVVEVKAAASLRLPKPGLLRKLFVAYWEYVYCTRVLPYQVRRLGVDLLHCTSPMPFHSSILSMNVKVITTLHDIIPFTHPQWFTRIMGARTRRWIHHVVENSHHIITSSRYTMRSIQEQLGLPEDKMTVVYLGKTILDGVPSKRRVPFVLSVGTIEPRKNLSTVLAAYSMVKQHLGTAPKLLIVGGAGWGNVAVSNLIGQFGIGDCVELLGFVPDEVLFALYRQAELFVYPSLQEGFGFPLVEAMACGCPVVTSNVSSIPEVVGDAGLMVDPSNVAQLSDAISQVLTDKNLALALRRRGLERAEMFSWARCAQETVNVYRRVLTS